MQIFFSRVAFFENETPPPSPANIPRSRAEIDSPLCWADRDQNYKTIFAIIELP